jgi:hypothetical protein
MNSAYSVGFLKYPAVLRSRTEARSRSESDDVTMSTFAALHRALSRKCFKTSAPLFLGRFRSRRMTSARGACGSASAESKKICGRVAVGHHVNVRIDLTALKGIANEERVCFAVLDDKDVPASSGYYTPDGLVQKLLDSALDPVLDRIEAESNDPAQSLLTVEVLDPACGSGHSQLAAARRIATRLARARTGGVASAHDYRQALGDAVRSCIHGVDRNPMAVELTKVALWIETVEPGKPLGFLDANVLCGDSLHGLAKLDALRNGVPDAAYRAFSGDDKNAAKFLDRRNRAEHEGQGTLDFGTGRSGLPVPPPLGRTVQAIRALPEDDTAEVSEKRRRFEKVKTDPKWWTWRVACDLYVAAFLLPKAVLPDDPNTITVPTTDHVWRLLSGGTSVRPSRWHSAGSFSEIWRIPLAFGILRHHGPWRL